VGARTLRTQPIVDGQLVHGEQAHTERVAHRRGTGGHVSSSPSGQPLRKAATSPNVDDGGPAVRQAGRVIDVRGARPEDDAALVGIDDATWTSAVSPAPPPPSPRMFFGERTAPADVLVAELDGRVAGYATLRNPIPLPSHAHVLELNGLAVAPAAAGRGVGRWLVEAAVAEATARGARKLTLRVLGPNAVARRLYRRCGFVEEGVLREEFLLDGRYVDDVLMARTLPMQHVSNDMSRFEG
jgi:ribosomal protein S18 acetylase RimI-like enzyme